MDDAAINNQTGLLEQVSFVINRFSVENGSDTPDFILADFMLDCLAALNKAVRRRSEWYGRACNGTGCADGIHGTTDCASCRG